MRAVVQRVSEARVDVDGATIGAIGRGLMVLVGSGQGDTEEDAVFVAKKIADLRIFKDEDGKMNLSVGDVGGAVLVISQFTLYGDCRKGKRPSFVHAQDPNLAAPLVDRVCDLLRARDLGVETGIFGADMQVKLTNDGPVTLLLDSKRDF